MFIVSYKISGASCGPGISLYCDEVLGRHINDGGEVLKKKDLKSLVNEYSNKEGTFTKENNTHKVWSYLFVFLLFLASLRR